ncbi:MAG: M20/M25/M40 family metallo-hydrolase [Armatimonadetes bacterium]|nr:M20/M25/M40 family metallo-hydrolase [Armatimonadota bacterium]
MRLSFLLSAPIAVLTAAACAAPTDLPVNVPKTNPAVRAVVQNISQKNLQTTVERLAAFPTRHTLSGANGADAAATYLEGEFAKIAAASGGRLRVQKQTWIQPAGNRMPTPATLTNVLATLPGTAVPERIIVVSGHYDSRATDVMDAKSPAPGANDDASGVAAVLELARAMAASKTPFAATVVFAAVTGEEQGLYGSTHLAETLKADGKTVVAMLTNDIVGNSRGTDGKRDASHVRVFSAGYDPGAEARTLTRQRAAGTDADSPARVLARATKDAAKRYVSGFGVELVYRNDRYGRGGDHSPFLNGGYPFAVRLTEPNEDWSHQHQNVRTDNGKQFGDLPQFVDYAYLRRVAQVNAAIVAETASAPASPANVRIVGDLSATTTLLWDASPESVGGYEILIRRTTAPDWERAISVGANEKRAALAFSKDDYLFAVRAVGKNGARGLPVVPVAAAR